MAEANKISTDADMLAEGGTIAAGKPGGIPQLDPVLQTVQTGEDVSPTMLSQPSPTIQPSTADITGLVSAVPPASAGLGQIGPIQQIAPNITSMDAAQIAAAPEIDTTKIEGQVSAESMATAATQELDQRGTVQYQLGELLSSIETGSTMPAWAAPAVRKVAGVMQARGLGASSMAAAAMTQAVMQSGIVIATQDANKYATIQLQNLNNQQKTALQNAAIVAGMDKANLSARL